MSHNAILPPSSAASIDLLCDVAEAAQGAVVSGEGNPSLEDRACSCNAQSVTCHHAEIEGDRRRSILLAPGGRITVAVPNTKADRLRLSLGRVSLNGDEVQSSEPVVLSLRLRDASHVLQAPLATTEHVLQPADGWVDAEYDLAGQAGASLQLELAIDAGSHRNVAVALAMPRVIREATGDDEGSNALLYVIDTLRSDHMSVYGYERETTPHLDQYAQNAHVFESAYSSAAWTRPGTAGILTSLYPSFHGANDRGSLPDRVLTIAERFRDAGYATIALVGNGNIHGHGLGFEQGFDRFVAVKGASGDHNPNAREIHALFLEHLDRFQGEPFFAYLHTVDPHTPYAPPPAHRGRFTDPAYGGVIETPDQTKKTFLGKIEPSEADIAQVIGLYDEEIHFQDRTFHELMKSLETRDLRDHLVTVLTSDHGEEFHEHGQWEHGKRLYEEQLRVPLIIQLPSHVRSKVAANRIASPVSTLDIAPTLAGLFGLPDHEGDQGVNLIPLMRDEHDPLAAAQRGILAEEIRSDGSQIELYSYMQSGEKLILRRSFKKGIAMQRYYRFSLAADPAELEDLASQDPVELIRLERGLWSESFQLDEPSPLTAAHRQETAEPSLDEETRANLIALGYIDL